MMDFTGLDPDIAVKVCDRITRQVLEEAKTFADDNAPFRTGRLSGREIGESSIHYGVENDGRFIVGYLTATARNPETDEDYAPLVHDGTGVHGPEGREITPTNGKFLVFRRDGGQLPKDEATFRELAKSGEIVFARSTQGQEPNPFLWEGLEEAWGMIDDISADVWGDMGLN